MPACDSACPHEKKATVIGWKCADPFFLLYIIEVWGCVTPQSYVAPPPPFFLLPAVIKNPKSAVNFTNSERPFNFAQVNQISWNWFIFDYFTSFFGERCDSYCWIVGHYFDFFVYVYIPNFLLIASCVYMYVLTTRLHDPGLEMLLQHIACYFSHYVFAG